MVAPSETVPGFSLFPSADVEYLPIPPRPIVVPHRTFYGLRNKKRFPPRLCVLLSHGKIQLPVIAIFTDKSKETCIPRSYFERPVGDRIGVILQLISEDGVKVSWPVLAVVWDRQETVLGKHGLYDRFAVIPGELTTRLVPKFDFDGEMHVIVPAWNELTSR